MNSSDWLLATLATAILTIASPAVAETGSELDHLLARNAMPLELREGELHGAGAELLIREGLKASFFALGESHLNNETPALSGALLKALAPAGYRALAIETGPTIAAHAEAELRAGRKQELAGLFAELPFTAAFIDHTAEFDLLDQAVAIGYSLWGLDQIFLGGARFNLRRLMEMAPDDAARDAAGAALDRADQRFIEFAGTGDSSAGFLQATGDDDYAALRAAFADHDQGLRIIDELAASGRIYRLYRQGANYQSNHERISLMKRHLAKHLRAAEDWPRVFLKFGSIHMQRGYTPLNQLDLGNAAAELGVLRGDGSIHVKVSALSSVNAAGEIRDWTAESDVLARLGKAMPKDAEWMVFDLRPLRPKLHDNDVAQAHPALADLAWGYDLIVVTRTFTAASRLPGVPGPPGR